MAALRSEGSLTGEAFAHLVAVLGPGPDVAARRYEETRARLIRIFEWRLLPFADDLADEVLDRVAGKLARGEVVLSGNPWSYIAGIARHVAQEAARRFARVSGGGEEAADGAAGAPNDTDTRLGAETPGDRLRACFDDCLDALEAAERRILLHYYEGRGVARIESHRKLAEERQLTVNALRIRIHRIRARLGRCVNGCVGKGEEERA